MEWTFPCILYLFTIDYTSWTFKVEDRHVTGPLNDSIVIDHVDKTKFIVIYSHENDGENNDYFLAIGHIENNRIHTKQNVARISKQIRCIKLLDNKIYALRINHENGPKSVSYCVYDLKANLICLIDEKFRFSFDCEIRSISDNVSFVSYYI